MSDFTGSKSATPMSTTASDMEREDRSSKSTEVQAAPGTRSISVGKIMVKHSGILLWVVFEGKLRGNSVSVVNGSCAVCCSGLPENEDNADVQDIIESTPELDMDLIGYKPCR